MLRGRLGCVPAITSAAAKRIVQARRLPSALITAPEGQPLLLTRAPDYKVTAYPALVDRGGQIFERLIGTNVACNTTVKPYEIELPLEPTVAGCVEVFPQLWAIKAHAQQVLISDGVMSCRAQDRQTIASRCHSLYRQALSVDQIGLRIA